MADIVQGASFGAVKYHDNGDGTYSPYITIETDSNTTLLPDGTASGAITTQNLNPTTGTATTGSTVSVSGLNDVGAVLVQVTGVYTGALTPQITVDGVNWVSVGPASVINQNTGAYTQTIASAATGIFEIGASGFNSFRISANAAVTGTANVTIRTVSNSSATALDNQLPAGTNNLGMVQSSGNISTSNGTTTSTVNSAATTNATNIKTSVGIVFQVNANNASAAAKYVRLYNKSSAPTVGTDVPIIVITIPASSSKEISYDGVGVRFSSGIGYAITGGAAYNDSTAVALGDVQLEITWA